MPVLTHMGHHIYNLPTALVSNTLDYGRFEILDTTDYMRNTIGVWKALGFSFDVIGKYRASAQEVGVGTGHGSGDDPGKQQAADQGMYGVDGQNRQGMVGINA